MLGVNVVPMNKVTMFAELKLSFIEQTQQKTCIILNVLLLLLCTKMYSMEILGKKIDNSVAFLKI